MTDVAVEATDEKHFRRGTHRLVPPEVTWERIQPILRALGITRVADVTGLDDVGIPVHQAIRPASHTLSVSQGKGVTHELARVSAAMEMIELAHAEVIDQPVQRGPASELLDGGAYRLRQLQLVPGSLVGDSVVLDWIPSRGLLSGGTVPVPRAYVEVSNVVRREWSPPLFEASTNGLASGNSLEEAALHALYELVERDCISEVEAIPRPDQPRLDPATVDDPDCCWAMERFRGADNWFEIIDATNGYGLPCFIVNLWSPWFPVLVSGSGCHLDPAVAMNRALTEAAQSRLAIISGTRESIPEQVYLLQHVRQERPDPPDPDRPVRSFRRYPDGAGERIGDDLDRVASRVRDVTGREPLVVDLGRGYDGIAVAKVVAPGLRFEAAHGLIERAPAR